MNKHKIGIMVVYFFSIIGILLTSIIIHENFHRFDFRKIEKQNESICYLTSDNKNVGYYSFNHNNLEGVNKIKEYTELKALLLSFLLICFYLYFIKLSMEKEWEKG